LVASEPQAFLGTWGSDVESFLANLAQEYRLLAAVDQMIVREPNQADVRSLRRLRDKLVARVESLGRVLLRLLAVAQFAELSTSFNEARPKLFGGAAAVIVGTAGYLTVLATSSSEAAEAEQTTPPAMVALTPAGDGRRRPAARTPLPFALSSARARRRPQGSLGTACDRSHLHRGERECHSRSGRGAAVLPEVTCLSPAPVHARGRPEPRAYGAPVCHRINRGLRARPRPKRMGYESPDNMQ
jgi:hypothetical protein